MLRRLNALFLCIIMFLSGLRLTASADDAKLFVNEVFDNYATNSTSVDNITVESGVDGRVVARNGLDKAL